MNKSALLALAFLAGWLLCPGNPAGAQNGAPLPAVSLLLLRHQIPHPDGKKKCLEDGGRVETETLADGSRIFVCALERCYTQDDGEVCEMHRCDLARYFDGTCYEPVPPPPPYVPDATVASYFHQKVVEIMSRIDNTGYAHNKDDNFSLIPDYTELGTPHLHYNLFLDCSGFVGYYVLQGLAPDLYTVATPSQYECQDRPLAADFADVVRSAPQVGSEHPAATMEDLMTGEVCWGMVEHVKDILPGDVIVYKHPDNIGNKDQDCDGRKIYSVSGNTGHILFAHSAPYQSTHCKANHASCGEFADLQPGEWQYGITVADATTSSHMHDSRKLNTVDGNGDSIDQSDYQGHKYHAWSAGPYGIVERCADGSYHRNCIVHGTSAVEWMRIDTKYPDHPTGVGTGVMFISPDRKSYRSSYTAANHYDKSGEQIVFIGRPIPCGGRP